MSQFSAASGQGSTGPKTAVVLVNLGTPDAPDTASVRRYLAEFLSDPRVIETPRWLWKLFLHGVILRIRPARSAKAYRSVWTQAGSPLLVFSEQLRAALTQSLNHHAATPDNQQVSVALAMRYGNPAIGVVLKQLRDQGHDRFIVLPLYPQYSGTTTASVWDACADELKTWRVVPELQFIRDYHDQTAHIQALAESVRAHWQTHERADRLLLSFHGIPKRYVDAGDLYRTQCERTAQLLAQELGLDSNQWQLSYQSRVGREEWLRPYTDQTLREWPKQGVQSVQVLCPGFAVDCLETLEEIAVENRETFSHAGGTRYEYIPCLNDRAGQVQSLEQLLSPYLQITTTRTDAAK